MSSWSIIEIMKLKDEMARISAALAGLELALKEKAPPPVKETRQYRCPHNKSDYTHSVCTPCWEAEGCPLPP